MSHDIQPKTTTARTTGIATETIAAGANFLGDAIDNAANQDDVMDVDVAFTCGTAATANTVLEGYVLYATDGTNYEDGEAAVDPKKTPDFFIPARNVTTAQRVARSGIPIRPYKCKILIKSELDQSASVTVLAYTGKTEVVAQ